MTNEQASEYLKGIMSSPSRKTDLFIEALEMAINALEAQWRQELIVGSYLLEEPSCSEEPNRSDLIRRQDAIDVAKQHWYKPDIAKALEELPSVQLKPKTAESGSVDSEMPKIKTDRTTGGDLINRQDAINAFEPDHSQDWYTPYIIEKLESLQSAQSEDYAELKREFLRMASYIDVLLECSDVQKETLIGFISRLAEFMPWTERD